MIKNISFLRRLFSARKNSEERGFSEEILGDKVKRKVFAKFWSENENDFLYLTEVLFYLESQKNLGKDLSEFKRGMTEIASFFKTCSEEESADFQDKKKLNFVPRF